MDKIEMCRVHDAFAEDKFVLLDFCFGEDRFVGVVSHDLVGFHTGISCASA